MKIVLVLAVVVLGSQYVSRPQAFVSHTTGTIQITPSAPKDL